MDTEPDYFPETSIKPDGKGGVRMHKKSTAAFPPGSHAYVLTESKRQRKWNDEMNENVNPGPVFAEQSFTDRHQNSAQKVGFSDIKPNAASFATLEPKTRNNQLT